MAKKETYQMQIKWNQKTTSWFLNAAAYTGFYDELASLLTNRIGKKKTICDLGCGFGLIDISLAPTAHHITCIDQDIMAIHMLNKELQKRRISNVKAMCDNISNVDSQWDVVLALFVGNVSKHLSKYLNLCREKVILIGRGGCIFNTMVGKKAREHHSLLPIYTEMYELGVHCEISEHKLEFGQPFYDLKEVYEYVDLYHKKPYNLSISEYIKKNLVRLNNTEFSYYLPHQKHFVIFEIKKSENLHLL